MTRWNLMTFLCAAVSTAAEFTETQFLKSGLVKFNGILCFLALLLLQEWVGFVTSNLLEENCFIFLNITSDVRWSNTMRSMEGFVWSPTIATAKSLQSCPMLCNPIDGSPPGSPVPGIFQARTLEWVAISFSNAWKWNVKVKSLSRVQPSATPWTAAYQAPPSLGFSRQESWSGVPLPSPLHHRISKEDQDFYWVEKNLY